MKSISVVDKENKALQTENEGMLINKGIQVENPYDTVENSSGYSTSEVEEKEDHNFYEDTYITDHDEDHDENVEKEAEIIHDKTETDKRQLNITVPEKEARKLYKNYIPPRMTEKLIGIEDMTGPVIRVKPQQLPNFLHYSIEGRVCRYGFALYIQNKPQ